MYKSKQLKQKIPLRQRQLISGLTRNMHAIHPHFVPFGIHGNLWHFIIMDVVFFANPTAVCHCDGVCVLKSTLAKANLLKTC
jgi:uncharacterized membrane protein